MIGQIAGVVVSIVDIKSQHLSLLKLVLQNELLLPVRLQGIVNRLRPVNAAPSSSSAIFLDVQDTERVGLGEDVHVLQLAASHGELHGGGGGHGLTRGKPCALTGRSS